MAEEFHQQVLGSFMSRHSQWAAHVKRSLYTPTYMLHFRLTFPRLLHRGSSPATDPHKEFGTSLVSEDPTRPPHR